MTPNVSRLLIKWGVSDIIGDDLVQCRYINMRNADGTVIQRTELYPKTVREFGFPVRTTSQCRLKRAANSDRTVVGRPSASPASWTIRRREETRRQDPHRLEGKEHRARAVAGSSHHRSWCRIRVRSTHR